MEDELQECAWCGMEATDEVDVDLHTVILCQSCYFDLLEGEGQGPWVESDWRP